MAFDLDKTLGDMLGAAGGVITGEWPKVKACVQKALQDERDALEAIAQGRLNGEIDDDEMKSELDDEKDTLRAALLACQVQSRAVAQKAANAAIETLQAAIEAALKAV
jgi:hypothetical protein